MAEWPISNGNLSARVGIAQQRIATVDRLMLLLPLLMWIAAAIITWLLVSRLLIRPLKRLEQAVRAYRPGEGPLELPRKLGPSEEIQELRDAFARAIARVEESERETSGALEGQRRLVREVHHRVKNNLQVVASLLNIHGRSAESARSARGLCRDQPARRCAVDRSPQPFRRNGGESRHRASAAGDGARSRAARRAPRNRRAACRSISTWIGVYTTQDVAVAVAFLITEIVEFAMLNCTERAGRDLAAADQRADCATVAQQPGPRPGRGRRARKGTVRTDRRRACQAAALHRWSASLGGTASICRFFRLPKAVRDRYGGRQKMFAEAGTHFERRGVVLFG